MYYDTRMEISHTFKNTDHKKYIHSFLMQSQTLELSCIIFF